MNLHPTTRTLHVAAAGAGLLALGVVTRIPAVVAFGGAMLLAVLAGRVLALATVTRLRTAGFEMVWSTPARWTRLAMGEECVLEAELRNRGSDDARGYGLRAVASPYLSVTVDPPEIDLPAGSRAHLRLRVRALRVGHFAIHAIALEVRGTPIGSEGLFEVPLMFANSHGIAVPPLGAGNVIKDLGGQRPTQATHAARGKAARGDGDELRELRHYASGDPFKRISWKASARRGKLIVRELDQIKEECVMVVLEAAPELYAGAAGLAPMDAMVEGAAHTMRRHLKRGDRVGCIVHRAKQHTTVTPSTQRGQSDKLMQALMSVSSFHGQDQSDDQDRDLIRRVTEHARPLDSAGLRDIRRGDLAALAERTELLRARAPFMLPAPFADGHHDERLRHYLRCYGVDLAPREQPRELYDQRLAEVLRGLERDEDVDLIYVYARLPTEGTLVLPVLRDLRRKRIRVIWIAPSDALTLPAVPAAAAGRNPTSSHRYAAAVHEAVELRATLATARGTALLTKAGARVVAANVQKSKP